ncbi:uncharacterized protein L3040_005027 [Drepanopeziza brunnea f. sp. 'multigermtubi']|uniref:uncharacterized protein n=1 Tax=Drepanopeziza brunnea f. sp. 'multigermtubi' TaxID=698441 RepID=UPI0023972B13|nr:hypothetical protein L3040_005027 [Drepanopeziza brunnea f. sp. 'multigermtubi']
MPSKIQLDENLWFLYICLQKSDLKAIDFNAVGLATSLKPPAARMRYTRLKRQIESGLLLTHTTPAAPSSPTLSPSPQPSSLSHPHSSSPSTSASYFKAAPIAVKRKRAIKKSQESSGGGGGGNSSDGGDEKHLPSHHSRYRSHPSHLGPGNSKPANKAKREKQKSEIKTEHKSDWSSAASSPFSSFSGSSSASASNSEDEIPLRKRRALAHAHTQAHAAQQRSAAPSPSQPATQMVAPGQGMEMAMGQGAMQGYNTYAQAPRAQLGSEGDRGVAHGLANMGYTGRGVYASPYVGFIDGRPTPDAMGMPAPGGLGLGSSLGFENGLPRPGLEGEMEREVGEQREEGGENVEGRGMSV